MTARKGDAAPELTAADLAAWRCASAATIAAAGSIAILPLLPGAAVVPRHGQAVTTCLRLTHERATLGHGTREMAPYSTPSGLTSVLPGRRTGAMRSKRIAAPGRYGPACLGRARHAGPRRLPRTCHHRCRCSWTCAQIDELFASEGDLGEVLEQVARLGACLLLQTALEAEVTEHLGRDRYERRAGGRAGTRGLGHHDRRETRAPGRRAGRRHRVDRRLA
jgi:hypothetical protein